MGKGCEHPLEVCMAFGTWAHFYIENGVGREISGRNLEDPERDHGCRACAAARERSKDLEYLHVLGLRLSASQSAEENGEVCSGGPHQLLCRRTADECNACGFCEDRCPMGAIQVEAAAGMNGERCIGCSVCVGACPTRAIRLR